MVSLIVDYMYSSKNITQLIYYYRWITKNVYLLALIIIGLDVLADDVCVFDGWLELLVLKVGVRGGELLDRLFPCEEPFLEFFLGEFCWTKISNSN